MCGGGKPKVDTSFQDWSKKEAERARTEETARQARITEGMKNIAAVFEGGTGTGRRVVATGAYDPKQTYYNKDGSVWRPSTKATSTKPRTVVRKVNKWYREPGGDYRYGPQTVVERIKGTKVSAAPAATQFAKLRDSLRVLRAGKTYAGIDPILDARRKASTDYYIPQLDKEKKNADEELIYALSRAGQTVSTTAKKKRADLREGFNLKKAGVMADIDKDVASAEAGYNQQRSQIESALRSSGDQTSAISTAVNNLATFAKDSPTLNPLTNTLIGFTQGIGRVQQGYGVGNVQRIARGGATVDRDLSRIIS